jgi:hypothetical protein
MRIAAFIRKITVLYFLFALMPISLEAEANEVRYALLFDLTNSPRAGAENLLSTHRLLFSLEQKVLPPAWSDESTFLEKTGGVAYRLAKFVIIDNVFNHFTYVLQHEVFGHGARYREFGYSDVSYEINPFFPWGSGKGWTFPRGAPDDRKMAVHELLTAAAGGMEASALLADRLRANWLLRGHIHNGEAMLYLYSANDLLAYIWRTRWKIRSEKGNDVLNWLRRLNAYEGHIFQDDYSLTMDDLSRQSLVNLLNPFEYMALYSLFVSHLWHGEEDSTIPMLRIWGISYLPSFRLGLTPYGTEFIQENYIKTDRRLHKLSFRIGEPTFHRFWGLGWECLNLLQLDNFRLDTRIAVWNQPELVLGEKDGLEGHSGWGGAAVLTGNLKKAGRLGLGLLVELGYKTTGFMEGENLRRGLIMRLGLSLFPGH